MNVMTTYGRTSPTEPKVEIYVDQAGEWRWRLVARNGETIASSGEGFTRKWSARRAARKALGI